MRTMTLLLILIAFGGVAAGGELTVKLPEGLDPKSAIAVAEGMKVSTAGRIDLKARTITFEKLLAEAPYDIALTLADGTILQGVNLNWYGLQPPKAGAGPMEEDDMKAVRELIVTPKAFENKQALIHIKGDNTRIVTVVELIRDTDFYNAGGNIVWRVEIWYFENQFGGWAKVIQQAKVLRRERFKDKAAFDAVVPKIKWIPELGGIKLAKDQTKVEVALTAAALKPAAPVILKAGE